MKFKVYAWIAGVAPVGWQTLPVLAAGVPGW